VITGLPPSDDAGLDKASAIRTQLVRWDRVISIIIRQTRRELRVSQTKLASRLGWTRNMIANIERGRRSVAVTDLVLIAIALNIRPELLMRRILCYSEIKVGTL
jgi:transcriptional regulator with XRE-family HTH domain